MLPQIFLLMFHSTQFSGKTLYQLRHLLVHFGMHLLMIRAAPKNDLSCFTFTGNGHTVNGLIRCESTISSPLVQIQPTIFMDFGQIFVFSAESDRLLSCNRYRIAVQLRSNSPGELATITRSSAIFIRQPSAMKSPNKRATNSSKHSAMFLSLCGARLYTNIPLKGETVPSNCCDSFLIGIWKYALFKSVFTIHLHFPILIMSSSVVVIFVGNGRMYLFNSTKLVTKRWEPSGFFTRKEGLVCNVYINVFWSRKCS